MDGAEQRGRVATRDVFTDQELDQLRRLPDISREELIRYFTLTPADEAFVVARHGAANRLGAAVQLCSLPLGSCPTMSSPRHRSRWLACRSGRGSRSVSWSTTAPGSRLAPITCGRSPAVWGDDWPRSSSDVRRGDK